MIVASLASSLVNFRGPLIRALQAAGYKVHVVAPGIFKNKDLTSRLSAMGATCHSVSFERTGLNVAEDIRALTELILLFKSIKPDVFIGYTIKPVVWGLIAAWYTSVPRRYALITGLGFAFIGTAKGKQRAVRVAVRALYFLALRLTSKVFFQNPDDALLFKRLGLITKTAPIVVLNGSGIDLDQFVPAPFPRCRPTVFLLIARLLGNKGVREFVSAARLLKSAGADAEFHIVGWTERSPDAISEQEVQQWEQEGDVKWHGEMSDVRPAIAACHVYVLPSYREGTPRTVLEAMAMGRPIITTEAPGCKETVIDSENGFLVPVRDSVALSAAMLKFMERPEIIISFGVRSREIAELKYDVRLVNARMIDEMAL